MYEDIELEIEKLKFEIKIKEIEIQGGASCFVTKALFKIERKLGEIDAYEKILRYIRCTEKDGE